MTSVLANDPGPYASNLYPQGFVQVVVGSAQRIMALHDLKKLRTISENVAVRVMKRAANPLEADGLPMRRRSGGHPRRTSERKADNYESLHLKSDGAAGIGPSVCNRQRGMSWIFRSGHFFCRFSQRIEVLNVALNRPGMEVLEHRVAPGLSCGVNRKNLISQQLIDECLLARFLSRIFEQGPCCIMTVPVSQIPLPSWFHV